MAVNPEPLIAERVGQPPRNEMIQNLPRSFLRIRRDASNQYDEAIARERPPA